MENMITTITDYASAHANNIFFFAILLAFLFKGKILGLIFRFQSVSAKKATAMLKTQNPAPILIDVRSQGEYQSSHVKGSKLVPLHLLATHLKELEPHKNKDVLVMCQSGSRSVVACMKLRKAGFTKIHNVSGGMMGWMVSGDRSLLS